jgi:hypothetical protein
VRQIIICQFFFQLYLLHQAVTILHLTSWHSRCCRTAEGRKCRLGEGGFGVVYKAVMNGVDEVAVKLVKVSIVALLVVRHEGLMVSACRDVCGRLIQAACSLLCMLYSAFPFLILQ